MTGAKIISSPLLQKSIPRTGEKIPVIGLGTYQSFDVEEGEKVRAPVRETLGEFVRQGGGMVDSSPMYGASEGVVGDLATELKVQPKIFYATKVWTTGRDEGIRQMETSFKLMKTGVMDLMQIHNLVDTQTHLTTIRNWKESGRVRYIGLTHYTERAYEDLARAMRSEKPDFVQFNYSIVEREAEEKLLPLANELGIAVIANRPFAQAALFQKVRGIELPDWAKDYDIISWAQFFLKFIVSHPAVTCAIPATGKIAHLKDNMAAGLGRLPDKAVREKMAKLISEI
ncbi:MAG: aldo/keto reductase [Spirochaetia bacterium]|nr:aldo/keto reductase [Spirochaetia bacterium]